MCDISSICTTYPQGMDVYPSATALFHTQTGKFNFFPNGLVEIERMTMT